MEQLKEFDMSQVGQDKIILIIGRRGTGKSTIVKDYFSHNGDKFSNCTCINPSVEWEQNPLPNVPVHREYNSGIVKDFYDRQREYRKNGQDDRGLLVMDSCLHDINQNDDTTVKIFMNNRHMGITCILTAQHPMGIKPELRQNIDYVFLLKESMEINRRNLWQHYAGMFSDFKLFKEYFDKYTEDYGALVIDNTKSASSKLEDTVYHYKAELKI